MSTTTGRAQVPMEEAIQQLVELAKAYASYAEKSSRGIEGYTSFDDKDVYAWVDFVDDVWFVNLGDVDITTNACRITFPYNYTTDDLVETYSLYASYLEELNTDLSKRTEAELKLKEVFKLS